MCVICILLHQATFFPFGLKRSASDFGCLKKTLLLSRSARSTNYQKKKKKEKRARIDPPVPCPPIVISCTFLSLAGDFCQLYQLREKLITGVVCNSCDTHTPTVEQLIDFLLFVYLTVINREYFFGKNKNSKRRICSERTAANFNWADPVVGFLRFMFPPQLVSDCQLLFLVLRGVRLNCCIGL